MPSACKKLRTTKRQVDVGNMRHRVQLQPRDIQAPLFGVSAATEKFTDAEAVWASVSTPDGKTIFDGINTDVNITHLIDTRYDASVTAETWARLEDGRFLKIERVENMDERQLVMRLYCRETGETSKEAAQA